MIKPVWVWWGKNLWEFNRNFSKKVETGIKRVRLSLRGRDEKANNYYIYFVHSFYFPF